MNTERFIDCQCGSRHWGAAGAAGLLLHRAGPDGPQVLLVFRSPKTHDGNVWGTVGGALAADEDPVTGAIREAQEELGSLPALRDYREHADDHGTWAYTTVLAAVDDPEWVPQLDPAKHWEIDEARWVNVDEVEELTLHPGLAGAWPQLLSQIT